MPQDRQTVVAEQSQFYRNNFRRLLTLIFALIAVAYALLAVVAYQEITRPVPKFFVTTSDGRLIEIQPMNP